MNLKNQVSNLKLSKELKKLGVDQDSLFYWVDDGKWIILTEEDFPMDRDCDNDVETYSAFTVAELGELLPEFFHSGKFHTAEEDYFCEYEKVMIRDNSEANARAKMIIYLLKNKLTEL